MSPSKPSKAKLRARLETEGDIKQRVTEALKSIPGVLAWRNNSGRVRVRGGWMHLAPTGSPDVLVFLRGGRCLGLELKRPSEEPSPEQLQFAADWRALGMSYAIVTSVDEAVAAVELARAVMP